MTVESEFVFASIDDCRHLPELANWFSFDWRLIRLTSAGGAVVSLAFDSRAALDLWSDFYDGDCSTY